LSKSAVASQTPSHYSNHFAFRLLCALAGSASAAIDLEPHNNLAYASPHVGIPQLGVPFPHHRKLYKDDEPLCDKTLSFKYGVASGDPFPDSVVIWTRAVPAADSPSATQGLFQVRYRVCTDAAMKHEVAKGKVLTSADVDFTVKVIVGGLQPSTKYYYDFSACDKKISSAIGKTKTLPAANADVQSVSLAIVSCSKFDVGYFHAYGGIADKADSLDAVLHLGTLMITVHSFTV
jgi:alkaline phosphatase D